MSAGPVVRPPERDSPPPGADPVVFLLALPGGAVGVAAGVAATAIYAAGQHWAIVIPATAWAGGLGAALLTGALAGLLPALRAARLSPTQALWTL